MFHPIHPTILLILIFLTSPNGLSIFTLVI
jgi:hypothetical protein